MLMAVIGWWLLTAASQNGIPLFSPQQGVNWLVLVACVVLLIAGPGNLALWRLRKMRKGLVP
jgi:hypothetical protein